MRLINRKKKLIGWAKEMISILFIKIPLSDTFGFVLRFLRNGKRIDYTRRQGPFLFFLKGLISYIARYSKHKKSIEKHIKYFHGNHCFKMNLDVSEYIQCSYYFGPSNHDLINLLKRGGTTMLDIGANVGLYTLVASQYFGHVYAFEPTPPTVERLIQNIKLSSVNNVTVYPIGLSDKAGTFNLYENPINRGGNTFEGFSEEYKQTLGNREWPIYKVNVDTLDHLASQWDIQTIDFVKIDVEGHEAQVLMGAMQVIRKYRPTLFVEVYSSASYKKLLKILPDGYTGLNPTTYDEIQVEHNFWPFNDVIYIPKELC